MDDRPDFHAYIPDPSPTDVGRARMRLRNAMWEERRRRRSDLFLLRAAAVGVVLFTVWSIAPATPTDDELPLIGLAQATASVPPPTFEPGQAWYVRADIQERVSIAAETEGVDATVTMLVSSVQETWIEPGAEAFQRTTVSDVEFPSEEDRVAYEAIQALDEFEIGWVREQPLDLAFPSSAQMWSKGPDSLLAAVRERVGVSDDIRLDRVKILRSLAAQMQYHGSDPAKRRIILLAIAEVPGIEVDRTDEHVAVGYEYLVGDTAQKMELEFNNVSGQLAHELVWTLATPVKPEIQLRQTTYEMGLAVIE